ncbi:PACE efflux transporter [Neorhizobium alkalisoli]|uniref:PACE efflux transporter n=1 Tax=Neorhizobium alkalisoli TaxID=528178 RepID=UPI000CF86891|nr:PACE efflux transporter [Neorhizobium alkalisoli]
MRSTLDRIRHAISFELIGLALITPLGALAFDMPVEDIGIVGVGSATLATGWNYLYNIGFDHLMRRLIGSTQKSAAVRIAHAILFELGLLIVLLPLIAWYLDVSLIHALTMDISFAVFYVIYAFVFNWAYDRLFPLPEWSKEATAG